MIAPTKVPVNVYSYSNEEVQSSSYDTPPPPQYNSMHGCEWNSSFIQAEAGLIQRGPQWE